MHPLRNRKLQSLLFGSLLMVHCACGNEPVKHAEELPKGRIPQMTQQQIEGNSKKQPADSSKKPAAPSKPKYIGGVEQPTVSSKQRPTDKRQQDKKGKQKSVED